MSWDRRDQEMRAYQDRINQLEYENSLLRGYTTSHYVANDPTSNSILDLASRNEKLEREAETYQREIKRELTDFIRESNMLNQCSFKSKYVNSLAYPPPRHYGFRRF